MKSKLRKLVVGGERFVYTLKESYKRDFEARDGNWTTVLRVFKEGRKNTPLEFSFIVEDKYIVGNPLTSGYLINRNGESHDFNIHRPWLVSLLIQEGINKGWNGQDRLVISNGIELLQEMKFEILELLPKK